MPIRCIDNFHELDNLQKNWNAVYSDDSHATIFVSWPWIRGWYEVMENKHWLVLAWQPYSETRYAAFLPLNITTRGKIRLAMGGNPLAGYAGFVCSREHQDEALEDFAGFIQKELKWEEFELQKMLDYRLENFLNYFSSKTHTIHVSEHGVCPYISLPGTWDEYTRTYLSRNFRKQYNNRQRAIERLDGYRICDVTQDNLEQQMDAFRWMWEMRWGEKSEETWKWFRSTCNYCLKNDSLYLTIIWDGKVPVAGSHGYLDEDHRVFYYNMAAFNRNYKKFSPGILLIAHCIRYSIENGYKIYDFLGGTETYKSRFGAIERSRKKAIVVRKGMGITAKKLLRKARQFTGRQKAKIKEKMNL